MQRPRHQAIRLGPPRRGSMSSEYPHELVFVGGNIDTAVALTDTDYEALRVVIATYDREIQRAAGRSAPPRTFEIAVDTNQED